MMLGRSKKNLKNWKVASNYGVFYPVRTGDETDDLRAGNYTLDLPTYKFYIDYLEPKLKSVYVNSSEYTKEIYQIQQEKMIILEICM